MLSGWFLSGLFKDHVMRQFEVTLTQQLDQLTAQLEFDAQGQPLIDPQALSDPRWQTPFSGLYWQIDQISPNQQTRAGVLRSRSLWDTQLTLAADALDRWRRACAPRQRPAGRQRDDDRAHRAQRRQPRCALAAGGGRRTRSKRWPPSQSFNRTLALALAALALPAGAGRLGPGGHWPGALAQHADRSASGARRQAARGCKARFRSKCSR